MSSTRPDGPALNRRQFCLAATTCLAAGGVATASLPRASAQSTDPFGGWFDRVPNYEGVVDATGQSEVRVAVGAKTTNGPIGFGPAAVRVDPGTTVVWEWTGQGGAHDVAAAEGRFESQLVDEAGHTFSHTFEATGTYRYVCTPHAAMGMKGAVVVGDGAAPAASGLESALTWGLAGTLLAVLFLAPFADLRSRGRRPAR